MSEVAAAAKERILIVDDEESSRELCRLTLAEPHRELVLCQDAQKALTEIQHSAFDLVVTDMVMPGLTGMELLERIKAQKSDTRVVLMSGKGSIPTAVKAMRLGAEDFIEKPLVDPEVLALAVRRALKSRRLEEENRSLKAELLALKSQSHLVVGETMSAVLRTLEKIAPLDLTVLITGETGTGKEVLARRLHGLSPRAGKPFVALNCGGIPEGLLESLLFGHEKGAFTGAVKRTVGYFEKAHRGTILLDEVGDMPITLQVKLLRVLQEKCFQRVGGEMIIEVDCRILASTHRNLRRMVEEGAFREDLFYRLNVLHLNVPPLRDRREDILELARYFLHTTAIRLGRKSCSLSDKAAECLMAYSWPGNVRELENVMERAVALAGGDCIDISDLPEEVRGGKNLVNPSRFILRYSQAKEEFERHYLLEALERSGGNVTLAAQSTAIPRQNLYLKLKKYDINPDDSRP